jgi:hypothetical protein
MKIWINFIGALAIAAIGFLVFKNISNNTRQPRPSNEQIKASLLSAVPHVYESGKVDFLDKTIYVAASTTVIASGEDAEADIASNVTQLGWKQTDTRLIRTAVFCKSPMVLKVIGPTLLSGDRHSYYLEASWGNYFSYCGNS